MTVDSSFNVATYLNGVLYTTATGTGNFPASSCSELLIGIDNTPGGASYHSYIGYIKVFLIHVLYVALF